VWVGRAAASSLARTLRGHLYVNHYLLGNRAIERIEPDMGDGGETEPLELSGPRPILLELQDIDTACHYFDRRYAPVDIDPARLVRLVGKPSGDYRIAFLRTAIPRHRLRAAYLRCLDWQGMRLRPRVTELEVNRQPCLRVRTNVHPRVGAAPSVTELRRGLVALYSGVRLPRYPSLAEIARMTRITLPAALRRWIDDAPTANRPLGLAVEMRIWPADERQGRFAYPTWMVGLAARANAPREELERLFPDLSMRVAYRLGGGFAVVIRWLRSEEINHGRMGGRRRGDSV
jgi:hypothetical protein